MKSIHLPHLANQAACWSPIIYLWEDRLFNENQAASVTRQEQKLPMSTRAFSSEVRQFEQTTAALTCLQML